MPKSEVVARPIFRAAALHTAARVPGQAVTSDKLHLPTAVPTGLPWLLVLGILVVEASR